MMDKISRNQCTENIAKAHHAVGVELGKAGCCPPSYAVLEQVDVGVIAY